MFFAKKYFLKMGLSGHAVVPCALRFEAAEYTKPKRARYTFDIVTTGFVFMGKVQESSTNGKQQAGQWGRALGADLGTWVGCLLVLTMTPLLVLYFYVAAFGYEASLLGPIQGILSGTLTFGDLWEQLPAPSASAFIVAGVWLAIQVVLAIVPDVLHKMIASYRGGMSLGAVTPAGNQLWYNINGLQAWLVSQVLFLAGALWFGWFSPTVIFDHFGGLLIVANLLGFSLALFVYIKAFLFPSHPEDRKWSGSLLYDFFMGIELNPRVGPIDFKLFFNGRPGIVAWTLINLSFAFAQYSRYGHVTNSMILVNLLHGLYVVYFFWKESWYLNTIDISHDHFGWMLAWGDSVWLPYMYTLQGLFLVIHPVELSTPYALFVLGFGLVGFWIFLSANNQKDRFRRLDGATLIWGSKPDYIAAEYTTQDGGKRQSKLLLSGWWGVGRHMNYTGDLMLSLAYSLACGFTHLFPYFYIIFMTILLVHRCLRDEDRCLQKYGKAWEQYCAKVPYRLIPGIF